MVGVSETIPKEVAVAVADVLTGLVGDHPPVRIALWDGTVLGPVDTGTTVVIRSPEALRRALFRPGELGFARAYVAGDIDVEGDIFDALELRHRLGSVRPTPAAMRGMVTLARRYGVRPPEPPPEESRLGGRLHSRGRDAAAISHHYDVSNEFYRLVLGPSMTYSCAVYGDPAPETTPAMVAGLTQAQERKLELVCRKLGLRPGMRILDVGCGWGSLLMHAARNHGVSGVGVTLSRLQADLATQRIADAGLADRIEVRLQDYRDVVDGPFDAISSIGMFEHVGQKRLAVYFQCLFSLLKPGGRLLNHGIALPGDEYGTARTRPHVGSVPLPRGRSFLDRYVFPDGELLEIGHVVSTMQAAGFEARNVENLREHYGLTLRAWISNLEKGWDDAVAEVGEGRARVWRLYMAGSALSFEGGFSQIHQVLAVRPDRGRADMPLRPDW